MSVYLMVRIECPGLSVGDLNAKLKSGPSEGMAQLENLCAAIAGGLAAAKVDVAVRDTTTQAITAEGAGLTASYDKR